MILLWEEPAQSVRDVHRALDKAGSRIAYTTVMTVLARLVKKGLLQEFRARSAHFLAHSLIHDLDHLALASFVDELARVSPDHLRALRELTESSSVTNDSSA